MSENRLEIKVDGADLAAHRMLSVASSTIKLLKSIEKQLAKDRGVKPSINWRVDMQSGYSCGLIAIRGTAKGNEGDLLAATWQEAFRRMKDEQEEQ